MPYSIKNSTERSKLHSNLVQNTEEAETTEELDNLLAKIAIKKELLKEKNKKKSSAEELDFLMLEFEGEKSFTDIDMIAGTIDKI